MIDLKPVLGLGVAGNFVGHLHQTNEEGEYTNIPVKEANAPKGIFAFYLPQTPPPFGVYPFSSARLSRPDSQTNLQAEAELALLCQISYDAQNKVSGITPTHFTAANDAAIRKVGKVKLRDKKNWGADSKGYSEQWVAINQFSKGGILDDYRLTCYVQRGGELQLYAVDSPILGYSYFYEQFTQWAVEKLNSQTDEGPLENLPQILQAAKYPTQAIIYVGATRYTHFGESTFLEPKDEVIVAVYDSRQYRTIELETMFKAGTYTGEGLSVLRQVVD